MSELPKSWAQVPIGSFSRVVGGGTPPSKDPANFCVPGKGIPWLTPADLSGYRRQAIERGNRDLTEAGFAACGATMLPKGAVLFSSRAPIGYVAIAANDVSTNQGFKSFVLPEGFDSRYCYYQLKYLKPQAEMIATGTTFKELSGAAAATLPFKVAPLNEQTRIADQLDTLLARIQACNDRLDAIPALLKRFRQSVLIAAISGDLTSEWRDAYDLNDRLPAFLESNLVDTTQTDSAFSVPGSWRIVQARNLVQPDAGIVYGIVQPGPKLANGVRYVQTTDIVDGRIQIHSLSYTSEEIANGYRRSSIQKGDVLLGIIRALKVAVVPDELGGANISRSVARLRPREGVLPAFLAYALQSPVVQEWLRSQHRGMDMPVLNLSEVRLAPIPVAPMDEQAEIVRRVDALFALADTIRTRYTAARAQLERLPPALLAKAFRGEMGPQDPNDEPADALLARIAAERSAALPPTSRPRSPRAGRPPRAPKEAAAMTKSRQDNDVMNRPYLAGHLRRMGTPASAEALFKVAELPVADFYKQLTWEVAQGHVKDNQTTLEPGHEAG